MGDAATKGVLMGGAFEVATPEEASMAGNGMGVMVLAVNGIQLVSLLIGAMVIGVFFYITTLHKSGQIAAVKALGASNIYLYRQLLVQITILVTLAAVLGIVLALGAGRGMPPAVAFDPSPGRWTLSLLSVYFTAYAGSLFSLRSILLIDPATALDSAEHQGSENVATRGTAADQAVPRRRRPRDGTGRCVIGSRVQPAPGRLGSFRVGQDDAPLDRGGPPPTLLGSSAPRRRGHPSAVFPGGRRFPSRTRGPRLPGSSPGAVSVGT